VLRLAGPPKLNYNGYTMSLLAMIVAPMALCQAVSDRADVTFINGSRFPVTVFLKRSRKTLGPIDSGDFVKAPNGFQVGENDYLVIRELGDARTLRQFAIVSPGRERIYRAAASRPPKPVTVELTDDIFKTVQEEDRLTPLKVENNTAYPISIFVKGRGAGLGIVPPGKTHTISPALAIGKAEIVLIAHKSIRPDGEIQGPIVDIAFSSVQVVPGQRSAEWLVVTDKSFGPSGLPLLPSAAPVRNQLPLEGKWKQPDGLVVEFRGENGYWLVVLHLAEFGFKPGDQGFRNMKEDPTHPGTYKGEVRFRTIGTGAEAGWQPITVRVTGPNTAECGDAVWKRVP
jgi:hypothetical protein